MRPSPALRRLADPDTLPGAVVLYSIVGAIVCFWRLGAVGLIHMEGMIVDGARRMLATGDWLVPRVYGELYTFKPALGYWLAIPSLRLGEPPAEWLVRFPYAASGLLMGLAVLLLVARRSDARTGFLAAIASISAGLFVQHVRLGEFDVPLAAGVGVAVAAACADLSDDRPRAWRWLLAYGGLTFGFLAKGLPALMCFGPGLLAAAAASGRFRRLFGWRHLAAVALFLAATGGYLAGVYRTAGAAAFEQPLLEGKVRGLSWSTRQHSEVLSAGSDPTGAAGEEIAARPLDAVLKSLVKPLYIWTSFLPWSLLLPFAFARGAGVSGDRSRDSLLRSARWFLLAGVLVFMLVPTHQTRYFLPLAAPIGILCALVLTGGKVDRGRLLTAGAVGAILSGLAMLVFGIAADTPPVPPLNRAALAVAGAALLGWALWCRRRRRVERAAALMILAAFGWLAAESLGAQLRRAASGRDLRTQAAELRRSLPAESTVWVLGPSDLAGKDASLYHYLERPIEAYRPPETVPPPDSYCVFRSDRMPAEGAVELEEVARVESARHTYLLARCGG